MSEKALKSALGVLVGLVLVYALVLLTRDGGGGDDGGALAQGLAALSRDEIEAVTLRGPTSDSLRLASEGDAWTVNGFATEESAMSRLWDAVADARVTGLIASNPANHARLGVTEDSTWSVTFHRSDGDAMRLFLGKAGPSFTSAYVRLPDEDEVYLVEGGLRSAVTRRIEDWRDRTIATVDTAAAARMTVERDAGQVTVTRGEEGWSVDDGAPADSTAVRNLLQEIASLEATGFADEGTAFEGGDSRRLVVQNAEGDTLLAVEIRIEGTDVLARAAGNPVLYRLSTFRADRVAPDRDAFTSEGDGS